MLNWAVYVCDACKQIVFEIAYLNYVPISHLYSLPISGSIYRRPKISYYKGFIQQRKTSYITYSLGI